MKGGFAGVAAVVSLTLAALQAQPLNYVASIKPNNAIDARGFSEYQPGGRYTATAITVAQLLRNAYRTQPYQLVGAPAWISTRRFDIEAKVEDSPPPSQQVFLKALLKDRFHLEIHNETRELPIFELVVAREGKPGRQLKKSDFDCAAYMAAPHGPPEGGQVPNCATRIGPGTLSGKAISMTQLATSLAPFANRFTVDKTGLAGVYDIELSWTPEPPASNRSAAVPDAAPASLGTSLFNALEEQLGLKLVSSRGPVDVVVVDRLEEPSGN
jgi:uncharacterized protein (TIGR03435 family)